MTPLALAMILTGADVAREATGAPAPPPAPVYVPYPPPPRPAPRDTRPPPPPVPPIFDRSVLTAPLRTGPSYPRRARADFNTYFSVDDYPPRTRRRGAGGDVGFSVLVGPDGRITRCTITASSGSAALDAATCRILTSRARYRPAQDVLGVPVSGQDSGVISWPVPPG